MESKNMMKRRRTVESSKNTQSDLNKQTISENSYSPFIFKLSSCVLGLLFLCYYSALILPTWLAHDHNHSVNEVVYNVTCQPQKHEIVYPSCSPHNCARIIVSEFLQAQQASQLVGLVQKALEHGRSDGGASIFDFHSGAISRGDRFINVYSLHTASRDPVFRSGEFNILYEVIQLVHSRVAVYFGIEKDKLFLTKPTFFSEMTARPARTIHDEYWHTHIDKQTYEAFEYTSLIYLSEQEEDFRGGSFVYEENGRESGMTVAPSIGLLSVFTSGHENPHRVEKIRSGVRYALTIGFTCDPDKKINLSSS